MFAENRNKRITLNTVQGKHSNYREGKKPRNTVRLLDNNKAREQIHTKTHTNSNYSSNERPSVAKRTRDTRLSDKHTTNTTMINYDKTSSRLKRQTTNTLCSTR